MKIVKVVASYVVLVFAICVFSICDVKAWIGEGNASSPPSSGGGGGSGSCKFPDTTYRVDCIGVSWIYYKFVGGSSEVGKEIKFRPSNEPNNETSRIQTISGECAAEGLGFWHFGVNGIGLSINGKGYFGDTSFAQGLDSGEYTYSTSSGSSGHWKTYNMDIFRKASDWMNYNTDPGDGNTKLNNVLYLNGKKMYEAEKYSSNPDSKTGTNSEVYKAYEAAYKKEKNGATPPGNRMSGNLYAFCWGPDHKLNVKGMKIYDKYDNKALTAADQTVAGYGVVSATRKTGGDLSDYKFIGWKTSRSSGISGLITDTDSSNDYYVSNAASSDVIYYDDTTPKTIYNKVNVNLGSSDKTVYAYYAEKYDLRIIRENGTLNVVDRTKYSTYAAAINNMSNSNKIYEQDHLKICPKLTDDLSTQGYTLAMTINDVPVGNPSRYCSNTKNKQYTVDGDTTIKTWAIPPEQEPEPTDFEGRARAAMGANYDTASSDKRTTTGFVVSGETEDLAVECKIATGCQIGFWFDLRLKSGPAINTTYYIFRRVGKSGEWVSKEAGNAIGLNTTGEQIYSNTTEIVSEDSTICYRMVYISHKDPSDSNNNTLGYAITCVKVTMNIPPENKFQAQARISEGSNYNAAANDRKKSSNYVTEGSAGTLEFDCYEANGCPVGIFFDVKTTQGSGGTSYVIERSSNGGSSWSTINFGATINGPSSYLPNGGQVYAGSESIKGGSTVCYRIKYKSSDEVLDSKVSSCVRVTYVPSIFEGKTVLSYDGGSTEAGWTTDSVSKDNTGWISCSATTGCNVTFTHYMKRISGNKTTQYKVDRTSNYSVYSTGALRASTTFTPNGNNAETAVMTNTGYTLRPGAVVCEKLIFKFDSAKSDEINTTVCAKITGTANSQIEMKVKNESVGNTYVTTPVYAKPGDKIVYDAIYESELQYLATVVPERLRIKDGTINPTSGKNESKNTVQMFDDNRGTSQPWKNMFSVQKRINKGSWNLISNGNYSLVNSNSIETTNVHMVQASDVGSNSIDEKALTNLNNTTSTTPASVSFSNSSNYNLGTVNPDQITSNTVSVIVPYNFINQADIDIEGEEFYAGETSSVKAIIRITPKSNSVTTKNSSEKYATNVKNGKYRIQICMTGHFASCSNIINSNEANFSENLNVPDMHMGASHSASTSIAIPDVNAGTVICARSQVYPATSGEDTNTEPSGDNNWASSSEKCFTVAKKPSLQVWGGNVYSDGRIETNVSAKTNLAGYGNDADGDSFGYDINKTNSNDKRYYFGSWGELGVISNGTVKGFASGASTGYTGLVEDPSGSTGVRLVANPGGSKEAGNQFCKVRNILTFANSPCPINTNTNPGLRSAVNSNSIKNDKESIIAKFISSTPLNEIGSISPSPYSIELSSGLDSSKMMLNRTYYYYRDGGLEITNGKIGKGNTVVVHAKGNNGTVTIKGNIEYDGSYVNLDEVPKLIIYAEKDINIQCNVTRIDALLVAENTVTTCSDSNNENDPKRFTQLKINGAVIASKLVANRFYGAATGNNSIIPAEIINYDPTLYLFGNNEITASSTNNLDVVNIKELAPRY